MMINDAVNVIIKFIYSQIFSRVDIRRRYRAINMISAVSAPIFMRPLLKCKVTSVNTGGIKGEWHDIKGLNTDRYIFFIHGGGFSLFSPVFYRDMVSRIARDSEARGLSFDYRLAPEHPYPAAIEDCISVYQWLLVTGVKPSRIAVIGDSAGGGLTLSLLQSLRDKKIPLPACAVCISAWADLTLKGKAFEERKKGDHLFKRHILHDCAYNYLQGKDPSDPLISPVFGNFSNLPPILFQVGGEEVLLNDSVTAVNRAKAAGTQAELQIWPGMAHDFPLWAKVLPDARKAIHQIGEFVQRNIP